MLDRTKKILNRHMLAMGLSLVLGNGVVAGCSTSSVGDSDAQAPLNPEETTPFAPAPNPANVSAADSSEKQKTDQEGISGVVSGVAPDAVSQAIAPTPNPSTSSNTKNNASEQQWTSDPIETADLAALTLNLEGLEGQPYGAVRDRIIAAGWIPHTFADTTGPESDFQDSNVQAMERLSFMEVKTCSGTGQGFCRFEFVYKERTADNAPLLVVTTTAASSGDPNYPMPNFWSFRQENISDLTYGDRPFDQSLFTQLQEQEGFCLGIGQCDQAQYMFKDALLISATGGFGTATMSLIPEVPVSKEEAIAYGQILDTEDVIDFEDVQFDTASNSESYYEKGFNDLIEEGMQPGGAIAVRLQLTPSGMVSEVSFSIIVL